MDVIYLDENASATPLALAGKRASEWLMGPASNASSVHSRGRRARGAIEQSRQAVARSLKVNSRHLTFTSGATESIHTVITGVLGPQDHVLVSAVEHPAVWGALEQSGASFDIVPVDREGLIDPKDFQRLRRPNTRLGIMMAAQNETGTIYPTREVADHLGEVPLFVDAVQAYGKVELFLEETGATYATLSGHKVGAPQGVGVIWCKEGAPFDPMMRGGAQERGRRAGTENVAAIVGLGVAANEIRARVEKMRLVRALREQMRDEFTSIGVDHIEVIGAFSSSADEDLSPSWRAHAQLPNTIKLITPQVAGDLLLQQLDLDGFCLSSGSACSSGALELSPVLLALGRSDHEASRGLRISMGVDSTESDAHSFIRCLKKHLAPREG